MSAAVRSGCAFVAGLALLTIISAGCSPRAQNDQGAGRFRERDFASRRLVNVDMTAVQPVADRVFRQYFRIDPASSSPTSLVSRPSEVTERVEGERVRDVLTISPSRRRHLAELRLAQDGSDVMVRCYVQMQRLDTLDRAAFARTRATGDDRPTDTPIDRNDASAPSPREEWVRVGRDRHTEQLILDTIADECVPSAAAP